MDGGSTAAIAAVSFGGSPMDTIQNDAFDMERKLDRG